MYSFVLAVHNVMRWVSLILGIVVAVQAFTGWFGRRDWTEKDRKMGAYFGIALDIQLLLGLVLYFVLSPIVRTALADMGAAMGIADVRFFAVEHAAFMILAVVLAHMGSILARQASTSQAKFKRAAIFYGAAVLLILAGIPWQRPLLPGIG